MAAPMTPAMRERSWSTSAPGRLRWTVSTYHASSGPESSARKSPVRAAATTKAAKESATRRASIEATLTRAATTRTGRRPRESAMPAVGSSVAKTTTPVIAPAIIAWDRVSPRSSFHRMSSPTMKPMGSHRVIVRSSSTR